LEESNNYSDLELIKKYPFPFSYFLPLPRVLVKGRGNHQNPWQLFFESVNLALSAFENLYFFGKQ